MIQPFFRSFWLLASMGAAIMMVALTGIAVVSARSLARFESVDRHASDLQRLRRAEESIMQIILTEIEGETPNERSLDEARRELEQFQARHGYLDPDTDARIREVASLLTGQARSALMPLTALREIETIAADEMAAHDDLLARVERDTWVELMVSTALTLALPLAAAVLVFALRRRFLLPLDNLRRLMDLLGRQEYRTVSTAELDPLLQPVFVNYNNMASRLLELEQQHRIRQNTLEEEVRAATSTLLQQQRGLARAERLAAVGELAAGVAHELRNPLAGIQMALSGVSKEMDDPEYTSRLDLAVVELKRVTRLLNDLLNAAQPTPEPSRPIRLAQLVHEFVALAAYQLPENVHLRQEIPPGLECRLPEGGLRQALWNLVINASQAIGDRGGEIVIDATKTMDRLRLRVLDDGPGFPVELLEEGFRSFVTLRKGGTGLGLATVRRFVYDLGGEIHIENREPHGAAVILDLPSKSGHE